MSLGLESEVIKARVVLELRNLGWGYYQGQMSEGGANVLHLYRIHLCGQRSTRSLSSFTLARPSTSSPFYE